MDYGPDWRLVEHMGTGRRRGGRAPGRPAHQA
jgi:hypothetical protein